MVLHGDVAGTSGVRRSLCDWLGWMRFPHAGSKARPARSMRYLVPHAPRQDSQDAVKARQAFGHDVRGAGEGAGKP